MNNVVMKVPAELTTAVGKLIAEYNLRMGKVKPIKRQLRITKAEMAKASTAIKEYNRLGRMLDKFLDRVANEINRLEDLGESPRPESDQKWLESQLQKLDSYFDRANRS